MNQNQTQNVNIDITKTLPIVCENEECGNDMFMSVMKFRRVPKLMVGATTDQIIPMQVFICAACGHLNKEFDFNV